MGKTVLIANRGEIACRIIKTAKKLNIKTIAIYAKSDINSPHIAMADESFILRGDNQTYSPGKEYLDIEQIINIAKKVNADYIHPGYGFLSENSEFASQCNNANIKFIGPPPEAISKMGLKDKAKEIMENAGIPVVPGYHGDKQEPSFLKQKAYEIGYPILIKATAGGGGKGMRLVNKHNEFDAALEAAKREAEKAFADSRVLIEKYITSPRHIEIQIIADSHGNIVHLFERDCSLQRRHQKVIEEAPAPLLSDTVRERMGEVAIKAAQAVNYENAGTIEFIVDSTNGIDENSFYFMEMNTRLQVEHPITEFISGIDLIEWQFKIASGEKLPKYQNELKIKGHSIEARIYAEDPDNSFLPVSGSLHKLLWPQETKNLRVDSGVTKGQNITPFYDPMLAKIISHGKNRDEAIKTLRKALEQINIIGLKTNISFLKNILENNDFAKQKLTTSFIEDNLLSLVNIGPSQEIIDFAVIAWIKFIENNKKNQLSKSTESNSPWGNFNGWSLLDKRSELHSININNEELKVEVTWNNSKNNNYSISYIIDNIKILIPDSKIDYYYQDGFLKIANDEYNISGSLYIKDNIIYAVVNGNHLTISEQSQLDKTEQITESGNIIKSPMTGKLQSILVKEGDKVSKGQRLLVIEAMKMEHSIQAKFDATIEKIKFAEGEQIEDGQIILTFEVSSNERASKVEQKSTL